MIRNIGGGRTGITIELISGNAEFSSDTTGIITKKNGVAQSMQYRVYDQKRKKCIADGVSDDNGEFTIKNLNPNRDYYVHISDPDGVLNGAVAEWFKPSVVTSNSAPTISSITPNSGTELGNTDIIIQGNHFEYGASVTINGDTVNDLVVMSTNVISCKTPAGSIGIANVNITNPNSLNVSSTAHYTYTDHIWTPKEIPETFYFDFGNSNEIYTITANNNLLKYDDTTDFLTENKLSFNSNNTTVAIVNDVTVGDVLEMNTSNRMYANFNNGPDIGSYDDQYFVWVVFKANNQGSSSNIQNNTRVIGGASTIGRNCLVVFDIGAGTRVHAFQADTLGSPYTNVGFEYTLGEWAIIGYGTSDGNLRIWKNGGTEANTVSGIQSSNDNMMISYQNSSNALDGNVRMVGFCKNMPDANTRQKIEGWAAHECNLTSLLPVDHPYKSVRP